jgi:hypothetical protein
MGGRRDDSAPGPGPPRPWLVLGLLAAMATAAVFLVESLQLRVGLLAVCWGVLIGGLVTGGRQGNPVTAPAPDAEPQLAYGREPEREVAERAEVEVELEGQVRQETDDAMREELAQLRAEVAGLSELRADLAALGRLRTEIAALTELRAELAGLSRLRSELAGLSELRAELAGLGALREDLARMRSELTEQLSGELLVERLVMRAQSVRGPAATADPGSGRTVEGPPSWDVDRWEATRVVPALPEETGPRPLTGPPWVPPRQTPRVQREPDDARGTTITPLPSYDSAAYDSAAYDDLLFGSRSAVPPSEGPPHGSRAHGHRAHEHRAHGHRAHGSTAPEPAGARQPEPQGHARLEEILAANGAQATSGGRSHRRRHREEDEGTAGDDVLSRVLGR